MIGWKHVGDRHWLEFVGLSFSNYKTSFLFINTWHLFDFKELSGASSEHAYVVNNFPKSLSGFASQNGSTIITPHSSAQL